MSAGEKRTLEETAGEVAKEEANNNNAPSSTATVANEAPNPAEPASKKTRAEDSSEEKERAVLSESTTTTAQHTTLSQAAPLSQFTVNAPSFLQTGTGVWPEGMKPAVREKLEGIFASGRVRRDEIDMKIMQSLSEFSEAVGLQILSNFSDADMSSIRNKSAFLAGVMKRFRTETSLTVAHPTPTMGAYGPGLGGFSSGLSADTGGMLPTVHSRLEAIFASGKVS